MRNKTKSQPRRLILIILFTLMIVPVVAANQSQEEMKSLVVDYWIDRGVDPQTAEQISLGNKSVLKEFEANMTILKEEALNNQTKLTKVKFSSQETWGFIWGCVFIFLVFGSLAFLLYCFVKGGDI